MSEIKTHFRSCNICEAMCGLEIKTQDENVLSIKADKKDPFSQGHICPKAIALQDFYSDKDRLKTPIRRTENGWEDISWQQAFSEITAQFKRIQKQYGKNSLGVYLGNPNVHNMGSMLSLTPFLKSLDTINRYSSGSTDQLSHHVSSHYMFGAGMLLPIPDIDHTDFMLIIGANPIVSNGSMMSAPNVGARIKAIQQRGGKVVVVDPRRTETAKKADEHLFIRPEKDALLLLGLIHTIFENKQVDLGILETHVKGLEKLEPIISSFSPEVVSDVVGIDAKTIRRLAKEMANANSAVCYSRMGASVQSFGGLCQWLINVLNIITGNLDKKGGAMFPEPAFDLLANAKKSDKGTYGKYQSRVRKLPYYNNEFPVATLADEILTPGEGQIKAMITIAGNPVLSSPSGNKLGTAFESLDFMVAVDIYLNETTQYANIILPSTTGLETSQYDVFFNYCAVSNTAKYSPPVFNKEDNQRADWEILNELSARMNDASEKNYPPEVILNFGLQHGPYGKQGLSLKKLQDNPHGLDLGPLKPNLLKRLKTSDDKIDLAPQLYLDDLPRLRATLDKPKQEKEYPFELISRRVARSHNTWTKNSRRLVKGKNPCTLQINPEDAKELGIIDGQLVIVRSRVGQVEIEAIIDNDILKGVVTMPQGWGHNYKKTKLSVASSQPGVSMNDLTDTNRIDELTGTAALNGTAVSIIAT